MIASYTYVVIASLIGIVIAAYSYRFRVTKSLSLLLVMLTTCLTLITTDGFSPSGCEPDRPRTLIARDMGKLVIGKASIV